MTARSTIAGGEPVVDHALARSLLRRLDGETAVPLVEADGLGGATIAQQIERAPLPRVRLAEVVLELDREPALDEAAEDAAGLDLRQLAVVTDEHELAVNPLDPIDELGQLARRDHPRLVDDHDGLIRKLSVPALELTEHRRHARALDAGAVLQLARGASRDGRAKHRIPGRLPCLAGRCQGERLARPGLAGDHGDAGSVQAEPADEPLLLVGQRRPRGDRAAHGVRVRQSGARVRHRRDALDQRPLEREMLTRGVAQQLAAGRDRAPVAPPEPLDLCHLSGARDDRHDVRRPQERVRRRLDRPRVAAETGFAERLDHVAATERRARARETLRAGQILEGELAVRTERRAAERPSHDAPQLLPAEPQLGRPSPPLPNKVLGTLRDVLLPARGQRRRLGRARSLGAAPFERRLDLDAPPAERLANRTRHADDLADPTADPAPLDAHRSRELRPQHGLVDEARRPRVRVQPPPVERRPAPVAAPRHVRHEQVRVQLRIAGTRRPVPEPRSHEPGHRLDHRTCRPSPDRRGRPLEVAEGLPDGPVMRRADARSELVIPDAEEHADALGR